MGTTMLPTRISTRFIVPTTQCVRCYYSERNMFPKKKETRTNKRREGYSDRPRIPIPTIQGEVLHGIHPVCAAISKQQRNIYTAFFKEDIENMKVHEIRERCLDQGISVMDVKGNVLNEMSENRPHQGVCLDASPYLCDVLMDAELSIDSMTTDKGQPAVWVLPYQIKDPMNMGAVLRSAYFFGVKHILVPYRHSADLSPVVSKSSAGALEMLTVRRFSSGTHLYDTMQRWKDLGGTVIGSSSDSNKTKPAEEFKLHKPTLLVIGNESYGLPGHVSNRCDTLLNIEGDGNLIQGTNQQDFKVDSLNVSAATAILLHTIMNSR